MLDICVRKKAISTCGIDSGLEKAPAGIERMFLPKLVHA